MGKVEIFQYEENKLKQIIELINRKINIAEENFIKQQNFIIGFKEGQRGTQFTRQSFMSMYATELYDLKSALLNPYFGKFEFQSDETDEVKEIYIGKKIITDENHHVISYDWRSPICSVYYDYNIGDAEYILNSAIKRGKILSKRQIVVKDGQLIRVDDQDTLSNDQILIKYLSENANSRLKSIIATIQREQNAVIRSPLRKDYILQGGAGSGKTTVALHRIAYLLYNESKNTDESEFMILGPNKYFLNYISELLPDLDIRNVSQSTFDDIALDNINCKVKLESKNSTLKNVLSGKANEKIIKYKSSIEFMRLIENFVDMYITSHLQEEIIYEGIVLCTSEKLKKIYDRAFTSSNKNYSERINDFIKYLVKQIKENSDDLSHNIWLKYKNKFLSLSEDDPNRKKMLEYINGLQSEIKKGCVTQIKDYFKFIKVNPLSLYQAFIENLETSADLSVNVNELKETTLQGLRKKQISYEDLPPLLLINYMINGITAYEKYSHLVIDEAQDLSLSQYYLLKKMFPNANFDVYGDVNQSIYDYQSIHDWNELNNIIFNSNATLVGLNKSYRTTTQISDISNLVLKQLNHNTAECISRDGNDITINKFDKESNISTLIEQIQRLLNEKYQTIAIICKDDEETAKVYTKLNKLGLNINRISEQNEKYDGGLCIMPSYLSKGLEFDAVILYNANDINYLDSDIDMKLLYVSITRAMHELCINYCGQLSKPLQSLIKDVQMVKKTQ